MLSRAPLLNFHFREITLVLITEASFLYTWFCYKSLTSLKLSGMHWLPCPTCWDAMPIPKLTLMGCGYLKESNGPGSHLAQMQMTHFSSSVFLQSLEPRSQSFTWFRELLIDVCSWTRAQILRIGCLFLSTRYLKLLSDNPTSLSLHSQHIHAVSSVACFYPFSIFCASIHFPSSTQVIIFPWILSWSLQA